MWSHGYDCIVCYESDHFTRWRWGGNRGNQCSPWWVKAWSVGGAQWTSESRESPILPRLCREGPILPQLCRESPILPQPCRESPILPQPCRESPILPQPCRESPILPQPRRESPIVPQLCRESPIVPQPCRESPILPQPRRESPILPQLCREWTAVHLKRRTFTANCVWNDFKWTFHFVCRRRLLKNKWVRGRPSWANVPALLCPRSRRFDLSQEKWARFTADTKALNTWLGEAEHSLEQAEQDPAQARERLKVSTPPPPKPHRLRRLPFHSLCRSAGGKPQEKSSPPFCFSHRDLLQQFFSREVDLISKISFLGSWVEETHGGTYFRTPGPWCGCFHACLYFCGCTLPRLWLNDWLILFDILKYTLGL